MTREKRRKQEILSRKKKNHPGRSGSFARIWERSETFRAESALFRILQKIIRSKVSSPAQSLGAGGLKLCQGHLAVTMLSAQAEQTRKYGKFLPLFWEKCQFQPHQTARSIANRRDFRLFRRGVLFQRGVIFAERFVIHQRDDDG